MLGSYIGNYNNSSDIQYAALFDGASDNMQARNTLASGLLHEFDPAADFSISTWFKPVGTGNQQICGTNVSTSTYWSLEYNYTNKEIIFKLTYNSIGRIYCVTSADAIDGLLNKWVHLLVTHDASEGTGDETAGAVKVYINGALENSNTSTHSTSASYKIEVSDIGVNGTPLILGGYKSSASYLGNFSMAQFAVWDGEVLNADDASAINAAGINWDLRNASGNYDATDVNNLSVYYILDKYHGENKTYNLYPLGYTYYYYKNLVQSVDESDVFNSAFTTGMGYTNIPFAGGNATESIEDGFYTITGHQSIGGGTSWVSYGQAEIQDITSDSAPSGKDQLYEIEYTWSVTAGVTVIPGIFSGSGTWVSDGIFRTRKLVVTAKQSTGIFGYLGIIYTGGQDSNTKFKFKINSAKKLPCGILDHTDVGLDSNLY